MTFRLWIAPAAWLCPVAGFLLRKRRKFHISLMLTGIMSDICLVLYLEFAKGAVEKALQFSLTPFHMSHIGFSTGALILYFPLLYLGFLLVRGKGNAATVIKHKRVAILALVLRSVGFIFMFSMWKS